MGSWSSRGVLIAALALVGCASGGRGPASADPGTSASPTTQSGVAAGTAEPFPNTTPATTAPSAPQRATEGPPECGTAQLAITADPVEGGLSHFGWAIVFTNNGPPCRISKYPGVDGIDDSGQTVISAERTQSGYLGGLPSGQEPPSVLLPTGESAAALLEGINGTSGSKPCPKYAALLVTPPNQYESMRVPIRYSLCTLEIHPVMAGTTGGANVS